jgi:hypothetical protein
VTGGGGCEGGGGAWDFGSESCESYVTGRTSRRIQCVNGHGTTTMLALVLSHDMTVPYLVVYKALVLSHMVCTLSLTFSTSAVAYGMYLEPNILY